MEQAAQIKTNNDFDWETSFKLIAQVDEWRQEFAEIQECMASLDGERMAAIVKTEDDTYTVCVNGETWSNTFEKLWSLQFAPDGRLTCIGMNDDEWTVVQEDQPWEERYDYVWNLRFNPDGSGVAANIRTSEGYGIGTERRELG